MYQHNHSNYDNINNHATDYIGQNIGYNYYSHDATSLNPSLKNLDLSQNNLYHSPQMNRSYELNLNYPDLANKGNVINFQIGSNNELSNPSYYNQYNRDFNPRTPAYMLNQGPNKRYSNYEYHLKEYIYNDNAIHNMNNNVNLFTNMKLSKRHDAELTRPNNRNFKLYLNSKNESSESFDTTTPSDQDIEDLESEYDTFEEYNRLFSKQLNKETIKLLERNQDCLSILIEGDIIEYVANEEDFNDRDHKHFWAVYMGNSMIMRFSVAKKQVVYESYWKVANENYIYINKDLDKRLITLPIYETLYRARIANNNRKLARKFSTDKNFAMWCRFDINKSDIEFATDKGNYSSSLAKDFLIDRFLSSVELTNKLDKREKKKKHHSKRMSKRQSQLIPNDLELN